MTIADKNQRFKRLHWPLGGGEVVRSLFFSSFHSDMYVNLNILAHFVGSNWLKIEGQFLLKSAGNLLLSL